MHRSGSKVIRTIALAATLGAVMAAGAVAYSAATPALVKLRVPKEPEMEPVVFKHWKHQRGYRCYTCHPGLFSMWEQKLFNHGDMDKGKFCGACHNGKVAFKADDDDSECKVCHVE